MHATTTPARTSRTARFLVAGALVVGLAGGTFASPASAETPPHRPGPVIVLPTDPGDDCRGPRCDAPDDFQVDPCAVITHGCDDDTTPLDPDLPLDGPGEPGDPGDGPGDPGDGPAPDPSGDPAPDQGDDASGTDVEATDAVVDEAITGQPTFTG